MQLALNNRGPKTMDFHILSKIFKEHIFYLCTTKSKFDKSQIAVLLLNIFGTYKIKYSSDAF